VLVPGLLGEQRIWFTQVSSSNRFHCLIACHVKALTSATLPVWFQFTVRVARRGARMSDNPYQIGYSGAPDPGLFAHDKMVYDTARRQHVPDHQKRLEDEARMPADEGAGRCALC
jgi:hypothetical protein